MKRINLPGTLLSSFAVVLGFICGCSSGGGSAAPGTPAVAPAITPATAVILIPGQTMQFNATLMGAPLATPVWTVNGAGGGSSTTGTINASGLYTAPTQAPTGSVQVSVINPATNAQAPAVTVTFFQASQFQPGVVSMSNNPLVASYAFTAPAQASVQVQFGTTISYGLTTSPQLAPLGGGGVTILVAGMRASTAYHMQAVVHLPNGTTVTDADQVFTTGALPAGMVPNLTVPQPAGANAASGVELLCLVEEASQTSLTAVVSDLAGNIIWYYPIQPNAPTPMKLLPNGHMLLVSYGSGPNVVQEVDLAGNIVYQLSLPQVQLGLIGAGLNFPPLTSFHHDVEKLPNGHYILLVAFVETTTDQPGITNVTGDALIDWDPVQGGPVWTWSTFDHLSLTHAPFGTSDWTHSNAVIYSPDDGNLILSMRNQNWVIKINYDNGAGDGTILWHLGQDGDFTLPAGQAPIEWNYGQHYPVLLGPNTAGIYPLMLLNNGNNRLVDASNDVCGTTGQIPCYTSVPTYQLNEYDHTAQVLEEMNLSPAYTICCGSTNVLANGDLEYDVAADVHSPNLSFIQEMTREASPQLVWQMNVNGQLAYRGFRIPSLYPGVEWTQSAIATANARPETTAKAVKP